MSLPSVGTISTIGVRVYFDLALRNVTNQITWGTIQPGSTTNVTLYIESTSNTETTLHLETANWTFLNSKNAMVFGPNQTTPFLNLTWSYNDTMITPGQVIPVTLTLSVTDAPTFTQMLSANNVTGFRFDMIISAEQAG